MVIKKQDVETQAVAVYGTGADELAAVLAESLTPGEALTPELLPTIKIPAAGGRNWELPDGTAAQTVSGVILHRQTPRSYWSKAFGEGEQNAAPDCHSTDGVVGIGWYDGAHFDADGNQLNPGGRCAGCPMAEYGSGKGNSQACRQLTRLFLLREGDVLPTAVVLPPSSYTAGRAYALQAVNLGGLSHVVTTIGLEQDKNPDGITYSRATFHAGPKLEKEQLASVQAYRAAILPYLRAMAPVAEVV